MGCCASLALSISRHTLGHCQRKALAVSSHFMRALLLISFILINAISFGQTTSEKQKILNFKNDYLKDVEMYKADTLFTTTQVLTRERLPNVRQISIFPKNKQLKYVEYYYNDTKILESNYTYKLPNEELIGVTKQYNKKGQLEYIQDHDKGTWEVVAFDNYPYYQILVKMKGKVDSLIIATYGQAFFDKYVVWSPEGSAFYNGDGAGATWYDYHEWKPVEFLLRYSIRISEEEKYDEQVEVHLNNRGEIAFPYDKLDHIKGFEKTVSKNGFALTKKTAIEKAKQLGLVETGTAKAFTFLSWKYNSETTKEIFNGYFIYSVAVNTKTITHKETNERNRIEYKFDVYTFNPWTGDFIKNQKMKSFREWEEESGLSTELIPDE
jgi:hypothetical protein